ncbi:hypothetical protein [Rubrimonas cliftonensis]|uniref:Uncharacterized protein n=1 Tax=Rubrimonas cliftonensis TaxID=89524 RepID=A0A1H4GL71_9RHOB|nr:hypothetical protein [Rubrimonas cliftonensis]SEB09392.1 hypothetical protein SAMN05444370_1813 [Rubrimonas cliftonensis]
MGAVITERVGVADARLAAIQAGRWLVILGVRLRPQARPISRWTPCYAALLCDDAPDAQRLATCRLYLDAVRVQAAQERWVWEADHNASAVEEAERPWRTTERGMALCAIARLLETAIAGMEVAERLSR